MGALAEMTRRYSGSRRKGEAFPWRDNRLPGPPSAATRHQPSPLPLILRTVSWLSFDTVFERARAFAALRSSPKCRDWP